MYLDWLTNKTNDTPIDGPNKLNESRAQIRFMRSVIASLLDRDREEARQNRRKDEPDTVSIEPRSSLVDLNLQRRDPPKSLSTPQAAPSWSYNVKNALGLGTNSVYEEKIDENAIVLAKTAGSAITKAPLPAATRVGTRITVPGPLAKTRRGNLARRTGSTSKQITRPVRQTGSQLGRPIAGQANPLGTQMPRAATRVIKDTEEEGTGVRPVGVSTPLGPLGKGESRKASSTTQSRHVRPNPYSPVTVMPGTGEIEGGEQINPMYEQSVPSKRPKPSSGSVSTRTPVSTTGSAIKRTTRTPLKLEETNMSSLINNHIEKFLKTRHGQKLKTEAESLLTKKD